MVQKIYDNQNYYALLVIFQTYTNVVLRNVHSLGWLLWLCFYLTKKFVALVKGLSQLEVIVVIGNDEIGQGEGLNSAPPKLNASVEKVC